MMMLPNIVCIIIIIIIIIIILLSSKEKSPPHYGLQQNHCWEPQDIPVEGQYCMHY